MSLHKTIHEVLKHYDYALITLKGAEYDNRIIVHFPTTINIMYRDFTIAFGAERVSKHKGMIKVTR